MHTWRSELTKELESVKKGWESQGKDTSRITAILEVLAVPTDMQRMAKTLINSDLGYFAGVLLTHGYHDRATLQNTEKND